MEGDGISAVIPITAYYFDRQLLSRPMGGVFHYIF